MSYEWKGERKEAAIETILRRLEGGETLREIMVVGGEDLPGCSTFMRWVAADEELAKRYGAASQAGYDMLADKALAEASAPSSDPASARLRFDAHRWWLSKRCPKKYGERLQHTGDDGGPVQHELTVKFV